MADPANPTNRGKIQIFATSAGPVSATGGSTDVSASSGGFCGNEERVSNDVCNSLFPAVAFDRVGNVGIAWHDNKDGNFEIYARFLQSQLDPNKLALAQQAFDPTTGKPTTLQCATMFGSGSSGSSGASGTLSNVLATQSGGRLDVNDTSKTLVLTAGGGTQDFQSMGAVIGSAVTILNGLNSGQTFFIQSIPAPNVAQLAYVAGVLNDIGFLYSVSRSDVALSTDEIRLTCNKSISLFPDIIADRSGRFHVVYQDDAEGHFELYYIQIYPQAIGQKSCDGTNGNIPAPISFTGFSPVPPQTTPTPAGQTPSQILIIVNNPTPTLVAFPTTGPSGAFFTFGDKTLRDPTPNNFGPIASQTGIHKLFKDTTNNEWTGVSLAADRETWNQQAALDGITVQPNYIGTAGNPLAGAGDFGTQFSFASVAWIAQTPPDKSIKITEIALPLHPKCLPSTPTSTDNPDYQDLVEAPKNPLPPGFVDPVSLADILTSPLASVDGSVPARFTIQGDTSGTIFTNILTNNGRGDISRFVFDCEKSQTQGDFRFILGQRKCGTELCALPADAKGNSIDKLSQQYKITLQVWQGPDYRLVPNQNLSAQMTGATLLSTKDFYFDPGENITTFGYQLGELSAADGRYLFFVPIAGPGVEFEVVGVGNGHEIWTTSSDGTFNQYYVPFTIQPNSGLNTPVYYEGYLADATSGINFYPPGTQLTGDCVAAGHLPTDFTIDCAFNSNNTADVFTTNAPVISQYVYNSQAAIMGQSSTAGVIQNALIHPELYTDLSHLGWPVLTRPAFTSDGEYQAYLNFVNITFIQPQLGPNTTLIPSGFTITGPTRNQTQLPGTTFPAGFDPKQAFTISQVASLKNVITTASVVFGQSATVFATVFPADANGVISSGTAVAVGSISITQSGPVTIPVCGTLQAGNYVVVLHSDKASFGEINRLASDPVPAGVIPNNSVAPVVNATNTVSTNITLQVPDGAVPAGTTVGVQSSFSGSTTPGYYSFIPMLFNFSNSPIPDIPTSSPIDLTTPSSNSNSNTTTTPTNDNGTDVSGGAVSVTGTGDVSVLIATPPIKLTTSSGDSVHPRLSIDQNDNIYLVFFSNRTGTDEVYIGRYLGICGKWNTSNQGGTDFQLSHAGDRGKAAQFPNSVCDNQGNVHVVYQSNDTENGNSDIFYVRSTNSGNSFLKTKKLTAGPANAYMPDIAIASPVSITASTGCSGSVGQTVTGPGQIVVVWHDNRFGNYEILSASKINGVWTSSGQGGSDTRVTQAMGGRYYPRAVADSRGNIRVVYHDFRRGLDNPWIFLSTFSANASAWDSSGQGGADLSVTPRGNKKSLQPDIDIDPLNGIFVVWHDTRFEDESPDQHEEIMASYCPKVDGPLGLCGPLCTNVEAFVSTQLQIIDCVTGNAIQITNVPNVCLNITSPGATFYRVSNDGGEYTSWSAFVPGATLDSTQVPWVLGPGAGNKQVCVQVQDANSVGFPVCQTITLLSTPPTFQIEFFSDFALTTLLPTFQKHPVATAGDVFVRLTSSAPLVETPTFDVIGLGLRTVRNQPTVVFDGSGFSGSVSSGISGTSGFSANQLATASTQPFIGQDVTTSLGTTGFSALASNVFVGRFNVHREDGLFYVDGNARLIPHGKDARGQTF